MADDQVRGWIGWYHHLSLICLANFFLVRQQVLFRDSSPLLSPSDTVSVLEYFLPKRKTRLEEVCFSILKRHQKRIKDIQYCYLKQDIPIPEKYLPK